MLSWYALYTKPHKERQVEAVLASRGIETYLPLVPQGTRGTRPHAFFPCYLFAHVDLEAVGLSALQYVPGVRRLVFCGDQPARVPQAVIDRLQLRLSELDKCITDASGEPLTTGDRVVITSGPLAGFDAVFDRRLSSGERVRLLVNFLQRGTRVEIEREFVRKVTLTDRRTAMREARGRH